MVLGGQEPARQASSAAEGASREDPRDPAEREPLGPAATVPATAAAPPQAGAAAPLAPAAAPEAEQGSPAPGRRAGSPRLRLLAGGGGLEWFLSLG